MYCAKCWDYHIEIKLPHQCECGHTLKEENRRPVTWEEATCNRMEHLVFDELQEQEDLRTLLLFKKDLHQPL